MPAGRPLRYATVEELSEAVSAYFERVEASDKILTISGLANALDVDPATVRDYATRDDEYSPVIKKAFGRIEEFWEKKLAGNACTGAIFWLKNRGWKDERHQDLTSKGERIDGITYLTPAPSVIYTTNGNASDTTDAEAASGVSGSTQS